jgi:hypothetical protein
MSGCLLDEKGKEKEGKHTMRMVEGGRWRGCTCRRKIPSTLSFREQFISRSLGRDSE